MCNYIFVSSTSRRAFFPSVLPPRYNKLSLFDRSLEKSFPSSASEDLISAASMLLHSFIYLRLRSLALQGPAIYMARPVSASYSSYFQRKGLRLTPYNSTGQTNVYSRRDFSFFFLFDNYRSVNRFFILLKASLADVILLRIPSLLRPR